MGRWQSLQLVFRLTGLVVAGVSALMAVPVATAVLSGEWNVACDFCAGIGTGLLVGSALVWLGRRGEGELTWGQGLATAAAAWLVCMLVAALPFYLSGSYRSLLDSCFDVMSGFTTTGLTLVQDLDHVSNGVNMWRHLLSFVGGQGMIVITLTFFARTAPGLYYFYVGEAKDQRLLPNVVSTARAIWVISLAYLVVGTAALYGVALSLGMHGGRAFLHALWMYFASWSTGGFAPQAQNMLYYHSFAFEVVATLFCVLGSLNFALHYAVLTGNRRELYRNIESVTFTLSALALTAATVWGLQATGVYGGALALFRKGFFQLISGHTTTGFTTVYPVRLIAEWGTIPVLAVIVAMLLGGSACSTAGGFKALRVGVLARALAYDVRRTMLPPTAISLERFHFVRDQILDDGLVRNAATIVLCYLVTFFAGTVAGVAAGFPLSAAAFESASAVGNVGLSAGVTTADMPSFLKVTYLVEMWLGRLEFTSVFVLIGFTVRACLRPFRRAW